MRSDKVTEVNQDPGSRVVWGGVRQLEGLIGETEDRGLHGRAVMAMMGSGTDVISWHLPRNCHLKCGRHLLKLTGLKQRLIITHGEK